MGVDEAEGFVAGREGAFELVFFEGVEDLFEKGAGREAEFDQIVTGEQGCGAELLFGEFGAETAGEFVAIERAESAEQVEAVEFELVVEVREAEEAFAGGGAHAREVHEAHVVLDEGDGGVDDGGGVFEALEDAGGDPGAGLGVAVEADAIGDGESGGLAGVVEQGGEGERERRGGGQVFEQKEGVGPDVAFGVEFGRLGDALHAGGLGQEDVEQSGSVEEFETAAGAAFSEDAGEFVADPFGGDGGDGGGEAREGVPGGGFDFEAEAGGEADGAEEAEAVFGEALHGVADGAEAAGVEVGEAVDVVDDIAGEGIFEEGVEGEVAAEDVLAGVGFEGDGFGAAAVAVGVVGAEGGDLNFGIAFAEQDDAEVGADFEGAGEEFLEPGRGRAGGEVVVLHWEMEEAITDAAADEEDEFAGVAEGGGEAQGESASGVGAGHHY